MLMLIKQSSIIGPNVIQAIINDTQNNWMGFPFLFAICAMAMIAIALVDVEKGRENAREFAEAHRQRRTTVRGRTDASDSRAGGKGTSIGASERIEEVDNADCRYSGVARGD
jgi:hypothetical protein